jgi:hypothetical protein
VALLLRFLLTKIIVFVSLAVCPIAAMPNAYTHTRHSSCIEPCIASYKKDGCGEGMVAGLNICGDDVVGFGKHEYSFIVVGG